MNIIKPQAYDSDGSLNWISLQNFPVGCLKKWAVCAFEGAGGKLYKGSENELMGCDSIYQQGIFKGVVLGQ